MCVCVCVCVCVHARMSSCVPLEIWILTSISSVSNAGGNWAEKISDKDREYVKEFIKFYNENYKIFQDGKYYRLSDPKTDDFAVFEYVMDNKVMLGVMRLKTHAVNLQTTIKLKGLDENRIYTNTKTGDKYYGAQLMEYGLPIESVNNPNDYKTELFCFE